MEQRPLGSSGLNVSAIGFGCGAVGGVLVQGQQREMVGAVGRALELGVTYFDTAAIYGDGVSETNLGMALREVGGDPIVGTKIRLRAGDLDDIASAVPRLVEASLRRIGREWVDLIQLHNFVAGARTAQQWLTVADIVAVTDAFRRLREQGKVHAWGINGLGEPAVVRQCLAAEMHSVQLCYNLLNPSAGMDAPQDFPFQDQQRQIDLAAENGIGVLAIRVLAGGALSGSAARHANAALEVSPIASGGSYADDVLLAQRFGFLVREGYAGSLVEAATRFALGKHGVSSAIIGISTVAQLEAAAAAEAKGPLPEAAGERLQAVWASLGAASQTPAGESA